MFYPIIPSGAIQGLLAIRRSLEENPDYFEHEDCEYDEQLIADLKTLTAVKIVEQRVEVPQIVERIIEKEVPAKRTGKRGPKINDPSKDIEKELKEITEDLRALKVDGKDEDMKTADRVKIITTRANLLEKMSTLRQQATNIRKVSEFMSTVLSILDDMMNEDDRQQFMKRIEAFAKEE